MNDILTASFDEMPASHDGESAFEFKLLFNAEPKVSFRTLRDNAFDVDNGKVTRAYRRNTDNNLSWRMELRPDGDDVTITLPATTDCSYDAGGVCTEDGTKLSNENSATVAGPTVVAPVVPAVSVGHASAEEGEALGFSVT